MKKLLFMYPIQAHRYLGNFTIEDLDLLGKTINERYRQKGYQIYFLSFSDITRDKLCLVQKEDTVIWGSMCFEWNTIRWKERKGRGPSPEEDGYFEYWQNESKRMSKYIDYPSFEDILNELAPDEETVIAGVDPYRTPYMFTEYLQNLGYNTFLDLELGENFPKYRSYCGFSPCTYNLQNIMINDEMGTLYSQGIYLYERFHSLFREKSVYRLSSYTPTISKIDAYFYKICIDPDLDFARNEEILSSLQYLLCHLSKEERIAFYNKVFKYPQEYVEFLFQACSPNGSSRFFFLLHLLRYIIEKENIVSFSSFKEGKDFNRKKALGFKNKVVADLLAFKKQLLENPNNISCQTDNVFSDIIKVNQLVDMYHYK